MTPRSLWRWYRSAAPHGPRGALQRLIWFIGWVPVDELVLDQDGTDLASAVGDRVLLDDHDCQLLLRRVGVGVGWRQIYDGPVPEIGYEPWAPRPLPVVRRTWMTLTFHQQTDGSWTTLLSPVLEVYDKSSGVLRRTVQPTTKHAPVDIAVAADRAGRPRLNEPDVPERSPVQSLSWSDTIT